MCQTLFSTLGCRSKQHSITALLGLLFQQGSIEIIRYSMLRGGNNVHKMPLFETEQSEVSLMELAVKWRQNLKQSENEPWECMWEDVDRQKCIRGPGKRTMLLLEKKIYLRDQKEKEMPYTWAADPQVTSREENRAFSSSCITSVQDVQCAHASFLHMGLKLPAGSFLTPQSSSDWLRLPIVSSFCLRLLLTPFFYSTQLNQLLLPFIHTLSSISCSQAFPRKSLLSFKSTLQNAHGVGGGGGGGGAGMKVTRRSPLDCSVRLWFGGFYLLYLCMLNAELNKCRLLLGQLEGPLRSWS